MNSICFLRSDEFRLVRMRATHDPQACASDIAAAYPFTMRLAGVESGGAVRVAELALLFARDRIHPGWFILSPALERYISQLEGDPCCQTRGP